MDFVIILYILCIPVKLKLVVVALLSCALEIFRHLLKKLLGDLAADLA